MKYYATFIFLLITTLTSGQSTTYSKWKEEAKTEIRLSPKYGNATKTKEQKESDEKLIKDYLTQEGTHRRASDLLVKLGFDYLYKKNFKTAMFRFNQAWLLDPKNENVFWGFGAIYFSFGDLKSAIKQYDEGLNINPNSANILTDKATIYMANYTDTSNEKDFNLALKLFKKSYAIDSKNQNTLFKISACYFTKNDCINAKKFYNECKKLGGKPITEEYTLALNKKCQN